METKITANPCDTRKWLRTFLVLLLSSTFYEIGSAKSSNGQYAHIPTKWVQIKTPDHRIKNVGRLLEGSANATWGKSVVIKPGEIEVAKAKHYGGKGLKLLRDLSFDGITLKRGCLIVLTDYPSYPAPDHPVNLIECQSSKVIINGKQFSGVFHDFETGVEGVLIPALEPLIAQETFKLPNGRLIKKGTRLKADGQWFPELPTNVLEILPEPKDP